MLRVRSRAIFNKGDIIKNRNDTRIRQVTDKGEHIYTLLKSDGEQIVLTKIYVENNYRLITAQDKLELL